MTEAPHGTLNRYRHQRCRCALCRRANALDALTRRRLRAGIPLDTPRSPRGRPPLDMPEESGKKETR